MTTLGEVGEHFAIQQLTKNLGSHPDVCVGAGDDCAVTRMIGTDQDQVFTTDPVIERVHFQSGEVPQRIGNKAAGRVMSDLAAMGAVPQWVLINVVAPAEQELQTLVDIYEGINSLCRRFGATVIGGDLARGGVLELHLFGTGTVPTGKALLRSGAQVGDDLLVTGKLGDTISEKHLDFIPRVHEGIFLRETGWVNAMMDISDGLATDLRHILKQSKVGAELDAERIPANGSLEQALYDGEDFELLLTASPENYEALCSQWETIFNLPLSKIGTITDSKEILGLKYADGSFEILENKAFEHFKVQ
jgi:thiamine-monophosphate kinase